jgi:uncharacterized RDD family membrane protein YckC
MSTSAHPSDPPVDPSPPTHPSGAARATVPAALGPRALARLIDFVLLAVVGGIVLFLALSPVRSGLLQSALSAVLGAALYLGYFAALESRDGRTFGKTVMKLRVVGPDGRSPSVTQAVRRNIWVAFGATGVVPIIGSAVGGLAQLVAAIAIAVGISGDPVARRAWHDRFAGGTAVVTDA